MSPLKELRQSRQRQSIDITPFSRGNTDLCRNLSLRDSVVFSSGLVKGDAQSRQIALHWPSGVRSSMEDIRQEEFSLNISQISHPRPRLALGTLRGLICPALWLQPLPVEDQLKVRLASVLMSKIKVCYHGNCFDGVSSAAVFSRFYDERINPGWEFGYQPMMHRAGALFEASAFDGDENAIVDFKYSNSPRLTWWFDHHKSAFLTAEDEAHFRADSSGKKFLDASYKSCTKFIADTAGQKFGFDAAPLSELIYWAKKIDGALYESAAEPVEMKADAFKLALVIENDRNPQLIERIIRDLQKRPLGEVVGLAYVAERIEPLYQRHLL